MMAPIRIQIIFKASMGGNTSSSASKYKSNESINIIDYNSIIYSEKSFVASNNNSNHSNSKLQYLTPVCNKHNNRKLRQNSMSISNTNYSNRNIRGNTTTVNNNLHKKSISLPNNSSKILFLEAERAKYTEITFHIYIVPPANFVLNLGSRFLLLHQEDNYTIYSPTLPPFNNIASPNNQNTHLLVIKSTNLHYYGGQWK